MQRGDDHVEALDALKEAAIQTSFTHLADAARQREFYNSWRQRAREASTFQFEEDDDCDDRTFEVFSFDFAQQVSYPSSPRSVGPEYFESARKCGILGVHNERTRVQCNYLIDEAASIGKGGNVVINLLHNFLSTVHSEVLILFADNCVGQNKNHAVMQYMMWCVQTGLNLRIELHFMISGHTRFSPDRNFGVLKFHYARSQVDCLEDLVQIVHESSPKGFNIAVPTILNGTRNVVWLAWTEYLANYHCKFPAITKYHRFVFTPGDSIDVGLRSTSDLEYFPIQVAPVTWRRRLCYRGDCAESTVARATVSI